MMTTLAFVTEVEDAIARGTSRQRREILRRVTDMFVLGSHRYSDQEIDLLDDLFERLAAEIEASARSLLAMRLAPIPNAPPRIIRSLAVDDAADVACPILIQCERLPDATLVEVAREKSQEHLFAISLRPTVSKAVTDILVDRGDQLVVLSIAENSRREPVRFRLFHLGKARRRRGPPCCQRRRSPRNSAPSVRKAVGSGLACGARQA